MSQAFEVPLRVGAWRVDPTSSQISQEGEIKQVEARTMRLLICLVERAGRVVNIDELLDQVWSGVVVTPDSVYQAITALRRILGDDPKRPTYIVTVPRLGYRMVATVSPWVDPPPPAPAGLNVADVTGSNAQVSGRSRKSIAPMAAAITVLLGLVVVLLLHYKVDATTDGIAPLPQNSVAVLPFLDLSTEVMHQE